MRLNKLRPVNGWHAFATEIVIVILGVMIALALGQLVDDWQSRGEGRSAQRAIDAELAQNAGAFDERTMQAPCLARRLDEVGAVLAEARRTGRLPDVREVGRSAIRPIRASAWQGALNGGTLALLPRERRELLSWLYPIIIDHPHEMIEEGQRWAQLTVIEGAPGPVSDVMLADLSRTVAELRFLVYLNSAGAEQVLAEIRRLGIEPRYEQLLDEPGGRREVLAGNRRSRICRPLVIDRAAA